MKNVFPDPMTFDIVRNQPPYDEQRDTRYAPFGQGTHRCRGSGWMELHLAVHVLMIAHCFDVELSPSNFKLGYSPPPSMKPGKKLRFRIAGQRRKTPG
jgi:cytochrome P450